MLLGLSAAFLAMMGGLAMVSGKTTFAIVLWVMAVVGLVGGAVAVRRVRARTPDA
jgi:hypothetical protein